MTRTPQERGKHLASACVLAVALTSAGGAAAQSALLSATVPEWAKIVAAARTEAKVVVYGGLTAQNGAQFKAAFEKQHPGVTLEYTRLFGQQLAVKLEQERQGQVDGADVVISPELAWIADEAKKNSFRAPVGPATTGWPARYVASSIAPILALAPFVMAFNTSLVKTPVTGYADLLKPEFKGRIGVVEPVADVIMAWYGWLEKTQGGDFLTRIAAQGPRVYATALPMTQAAIGGEIAFAAYTTPAVVMPFVRQGAPVRMVVPDPSLGTAYAGVVLSWARRPNAAQLYLDFMMSVPGQSAWAGGGEVASPLGVPGSLDARSIIVPDTSGYTAATRRDFDTKFRGLFTAR